MRPRFLATLAFGALAAFAACASDPGRGNGTDDVEGDGRDELDSGDGEGPTPIDARGGDTSSGEDGDADLDHDDALASDTTTDTADAADIADAPDVACEALGCACDRDGDCASGFCVDGGAGIGRVCSELCTDSCSLTAYECVVLINVSGDAVRLCVPASASFCEPCVSDRSCGRLGDVCLPLIDGSFCATDCSGTRTCPPGASCVPRVIDGLERDLCMPDLEVCSPCLDADNDDYGVGTNCLGYDCDDSLPTVHESAAELCDGIDNDCDLDVDEDTLLATDPFNCGACGTTCVGVNGESSCVGGECTVTACADGWHDCDGVERNGCERSTDELNGCGGCGEIAVPPGIPCGPCFDGETACIGTDATECLGAVADSDGDSICDDTDRCAGHDDRVDSDSDTVPDGCDLCPGSSDRDDADGDGAPDACDRCAVGPDGADVDGDGVPDACDCDQAGCDADATCGESLTGPTCACGPGYLGDGFDCAPVDCGSFANPDGGSWSFTGTTYLETATLACRAGWTLNGTDTRTCGADGNWAGTGWCTNPNQIWCACGGEYAAGDRVIAAVDWVAFPNAAGQTIGRGRLGTVRGGGSTGFPLLVEWDGWSGGTGVCGGALQCGACTGSGSARYWVLCGDVDPWIP